MRLVGILLPRPGIKPVLPVVGAPSRSHWSTRGVPVLLFWNGLTRSPSLHLSGGLDAESRVPWTQCHEEKGQKNMKDVLQVCMSPAQQFHGWWFWTLRLYRLTWQFHWCGWIEVRALVGSQSCASSWSTGGHPARRWYRCIWYVCPHARSCRTHTFIHDLEEPPWAFSLTDVPKMKWRQMGLMADKDSRNIRPPDASW